MSVEKGYALDWIARNRDKIVEISDKVWEHAELGLIEFKSSALLADELKKQGFKVERGIADMPTAFLATWGAGKPVIGIMGEYDALPGLSQKKVPSNKTLQPGAPGHGCGHNIHGTSGMAAAIAVRIAMEKHKIKGTIRFFGCPAEENFSGKVYMVREGYFSDVDAVISHHPSTMNAADLRSSLAVNSIKFHFYGKASHAGASPEQGRSALDAVELMNTGVNYLREHVIQDARIHYVIEKGGDQPNIVPPYARSWYYVRAPERDQLEFIYNWILEIAKGAAIMTRTKVRTEFLEGSYNVIPNKAISELIVKNMREIGLPEYSDEDLKFAKEIAKTITLEMKIAQLKKSKRPGWEKLVDKLMDDEIPDPWGEGEVSHGSTDVADVSWQTPTVEFTTATWVLGTPGHSWQNVAQSAVGLGHNSLIFSAKVMAATSLDFLMNEEILNEAKKEHRQRVGNKKYRSPIPPENRPPLDIWEK
ncbi:MAG: M20 family metallopeptidase [Candidatus Bathyarchaeota archaeon]|nr:M20 family metallopeptidase [Candidatus Bathyarchaeota archaeon]MDH5732632.1 M20 family metallopeptidase [Candidatus Bathyarchaeota archaeon]